MSGMWRMADTCVRILILVALLAITPGTASAQGNSAGMPENSHAQRYGRGWECDRGYRKSGGRCVAIALPANAYLNAYGDRWECDRGYLQAGSGCVAVKVPANGYLWDTSQKPGWKCERGYRAVKAACIAVMMPPNAHLDYSGNKWECNRSYRKKNDKCYRN